MRSYSPQLDGLRALAVAAVAWSHWERPYQLGIPFGAGVHLFYVLSGFLITRILLDVREQTDRVAGLRAFYARRALRIFPAFYLHWRPEEAGTWPIMAYTASFAVLLL